MPIVRGTRVVLMQGTNGAIPGDSGKVSSRKRNGWLRVTIDRTNETISVRNDPLKVGVKVAASYQRSPEPETPAQVIKTPPVVRKLDFSDE